MCVSDFFFVAADKRAEALGYARAEQRLAYLATLPEASPQPTDEEKKNEADSDVDEMMDSDNDADDEAAGPPGVPDGAASHILSPGSALGNALAGLSVDGAPALAAPPGATT